MTYIDKIGLNSTTNAAGVNNSSAKEQTQETETANYSVQNPSSEDELAVFTEENEASSDGVEMSDEEYQEILAALKEKFSNNKDAGEEIPLASSALTSSSGNSALDALYFKQQLLMNEQTRLNAQIAKKQKQKQKLESKLNSNNNMEDSAKSNLESRISKLEGDISSLESSLATCKSNLSSVASEIQKEITSPTNSIASTTGANSSSASTYTGQGTGEVPSDLAQRLDEKLGSGFTAKLEEIAGKLKCDPNNLLAMMYSESGIDPHCVAYNGAVGLCMFMPSILEAKGYNPSEVASMSGVEQLDIAYEFLHESKTSFVGLSDDDVLDGGTLYAMNFLPAYAKDEVLCSAGDIYYNANSPLDLDGDGNISKTDLAKRLQSKYDELYQWF